MGNDNDRDDAAREEEFEAAVSDAELSLNAILDVLAHHHRREMLRLLSDTPDHTATVDEVVTHLIDREADRTGTQPSRDSIEVNLHHTHLPKVTDTGIVEFDTRSQEMRYWKHDSVEDILEYVQSYETA